jgi:maltooligosyltrehalose synthase
VLDTYIKWFEAHERALIVALIMGIGVYGWNHYVDKSAESAANKAAVSAQIAEAAKEQDAKNAAMVAQLQAAFNAQQAQRDQEIANLVAAISQRDAVVSKKVAEVRDPKMTPIDALNTLSEAYAPYQFLEPIPISDNSRLSFSVADVQEFTVAKIEGDAAKDDLKDTQDELKDEQASFAQLAGVNTGLQTRIDGLNTVITKNNNQCDADKKSLKDAARKSKWHLFWWGYGAGFVSDEILHRLLGK